MGEEGSKLTADATDTAEHLVDSLASLGASSKKMFGGYGIFADGVMFALVDSNGVGHLRADDTTVDRFQEADSTKHSRMPYWSLPQAVLDDASSLVEWGAQALVVAKNAK